jgi:hypothetical protein
MLKHQILITFPSVRQFNDRQFTQEYDETFIRWYVVNEAKSWWLTGEGFGFAERISDPRVTGRQVEQFMFHVLKQRMVGDEDTPVSFTDVSWRVIQKIPPKVMTVIKNAQRR